MTTEKTTVPPRTAEALRHVSTATITTQLLSRGLRNTFLHGLSPINRLKANLVGQAFTLRYIPAREDLDILAIFEDYDHPQRRAVESVPPGQVLVMDCRRQTRAASLGNILATRLAHRGAAGIVTDGSVRDSPAFATLKLPTFGAGVSATTNLALHHAVDIQVPISCADVPVYPGDLIVGDTEGVVCIPQHLAVEVAEAAIEQERLERFILSRIEEGAPLRGTYPPDKQTLAQYRDRTS